MVARAMRAFGFGDLVLVGGVSPLHPQALAAAAGADAVLEAARQVAGLTEALEGVGLAIGTTARKYERPDLQVVPVRQAAALAKSSGDDAAWVFGTEKHGLPAADLQQCHQIARIPAPGPSLNLAQAASICLYESRVALDDHLEAAPPEAAMRNLASVLPRDDLAGWLKRLGVAGERDAASKAHTLLRLASRVGLDEHEAALVTAIRHRLRVQ